MFGYRLVRDADWDELKAEVKTLRGERDAAIKDAAVAHARSDIGAVAARADLMTTRVNALEVEAAHARHAGTGLPAVAATVGVGQPIMTERMNSTAELWEDAGDQAARDLAERGLLHDQGPANGGLEGARDMSAFLDEKDPQPAHVS